MGPHGRCGLVGHHGGVTTLIGDALHQRWIRAVVYEGERFGVLAQELAVGLTPVQGGLDVAVPWIPVWTAGDLVRHLGTVHRWATAILHARHADHPPGEAIHAPHAEALLDWYATGLTGLVATLGTTDPAAPAWHMSPAAPTVAASWARRQAHELLVHRMDLEAAAGVPHAAVDADLATDGVDELLRIIVPRWAHTEPLASADVAVTVTATDTGSSWTVTVARGDVEVMTGRSATTAAQLCGSATQLLLHLRGRPADVELTGDPAAESILRGR